MVTLVHKNQAEHFVELEFCKRGLLKWALMIQSCSNFPLYCEENLNAITSNTRNSLVKYHIKQLTK